MALPLRGRRLYLLGRVGLSGGKYQNNNNNNRKVKTRCIASLPTNTKQHNIMKKIIKLSTALITITLLTINLSFAQTPPLPNGDGGNPSSGSNTPVGGGAPIGGGLLILVVLGAGYGAKKVYDFNKKKLAE